jgi:hypothetical protein
LQELDLSDCWLLSEDAVLNFCEAYPSIMLWNERNLVNISKLPKIQTPSKEFADVVSGEKATSFTREMQKARIQSRKGSSGPLKKELPKARKTTSTSGTAGGSSRSVIIVGKYATDVHIWVTSSSGLSTCHTVSNSIFRFCIHKGRTV